MSPRFLFGPVSAGFAAENLLKHRESGACLTFGDSKSDLTIHANDSWDVVSKRLPAGYQPDFVVVHLQYRTIPAAVWKAPIPVIGLAGDWNLLWHYYRRQLQLCDLVLTDTVGTEIMARQGLGHTRGANIFGCEKRFIKPPVVERRRDIDILFVGNLHPAVQRERLAWLGRIARLSDRCKVVIATGVFGEEYERLLARSKIIFNRSIRQEWNNRTSEALAAGALLFQEAENREVASHLADREECVLYNSENLESLLDYYLEREDEQQAISEAGQRRAAEFSFEALWAKHLDLIQGEWEGLVERAKARMSAANNRDLLTRTWEAYCSTFGNDPSLIGDLKQAVATAPTSANLHNALGIALAVQKTDDRSSALADATEAFRSAWRGDSTHLVAGLNLAEMLVENGKQAEAIDQCEQVLAALDKAGALDAESLDAPHYPPAFDHFRVEWERAAWDNAGHPEGEAEAKRTLLRWRLHLLLGNLTNAVHHFEEAARARPDLPVSQGALGCALGRHRRYKEAIEPLALAVEANPFDCDAARALYEVLGNVESRQAQARLIEERRRLADAAPQAIPTETWFAEKPVSLRQRFASITPEEFQKRYGVLDIGRAVCGFTKPIDTQVVLTLLAHARPQRILEIGTAGGHMTANLTEWSPENATVFSMGVVADLGIKTSNEQQYEDPPRSEFGRFANHFGKIHKVCFVTADSMRYDFERLAPIDFAFVDGAHDLEHVLSDSQRVYEILNPGGLILWHDFGSPTPWVKVREALERLSFQEPIVQVAGTEVAYLQKQEPKEQNAPAADQTDRLAVVWEGDQKALHSLSLVNRQMCLGLIQRGHEVSILPDACEPEGDVPPRLVGRFHIPLSRRPDAHIRHRWPPDFRPPRDGHWVMIQPWEFGSLPVSWIAPMRDELDEIWVPTTFVRNCFIESGVPGDKVFVVPNGVSLDVIGKQTRPFALKTKKAFKFLFVGGTIYRKGIDVLLEAYARSFRRSDGVCLVIKDMGGDTFYQGQTARERIAELRERPDSPEIEYIDRRLSDEEMASLYAACQCLVHPYRGEGFGLPIAEAMASGLPAIVTGAGAALDFCNENTTYLVAAEKRVFKEKHVSNLETANHPWVYEPDVDRLCHLMGHVVEHQDEAKTKGRTASEHIRRNFTWEHAVAAAEARLRALCEKPIARFKSPIATRSVPAMPRPAAQRAKVSLCMIVKNEEKNLPACLESVRGLCDEIVVVDTGSSDRTIEIAKRFGARVPEFPWIDSFAAARNESLRHATGDWIFWMDADDRLDDENRGKLRQVLANLPDENDAYVMKCLCLPDPDTGASVVVDHVRLFRNRPDIRWKYRIHEQILPAIRRSGGSVRWSDVVIHHVGYQDKALRLKKRERDLRLLMLENTENPDDPFTLFNLGSVYQEQGKHAEAIEVMQRSLNDSHPTDSIVRKLYASIAQSHRHLGQRDEALTVCQAGRRVYPEDAELLFQEGIVRREIGDRRGAEACFLQLLNNKEASHFASIDTGIQGYKTRHNLAVVYYEEKRLPEAETQWREATAEKPDFAPALLGLGDVFLAQQRWDEMEGLAAKLEGLPQASVDAGILRARTLLARKEFRPARTRLEGLIQKVPELLAPRIFLSHVLLQQGKDWKAAEQALRDVLALDPTNVEAQQNLTVLLQRKVEKRGKRK